MISVESIFVTFPWFISAEASCGCLGADKPVKQFGLPAIEKTNCLWFSQLNSQKVKHLWQFWGSIPWFAQTFFKANQPLRLHRIGAVRACPARKSATKLFQNALSRWKKRTSIDVSTPNAFSQKDESPFSMWGPLYFHSAFIDPCWAAAFLTPSCLGRSTGRIESAYLERGNRSGRHRRPARLSWSWATFGVEGRKGDGLRVLSGSWEIYENLWKHMETYGYIHVQIYANICN